MTLPKNSLPFHDASEPLRCRAPLRDEHGGPLSDFMVLIPGLKHKPGNLIGKTVADVYRVLGRYNHAVVFAEFNIRLNLLWVSIRPIPRIRFEIMEAIREYLPEARLVCQP